MADSTPHMLQRERSLILGGLLVLAALAWVLLIWQSRTMSNQAMGLTMGMSAILFMAIWIVMMVAMMFPTAAPMILMFSKIYQSRRQQERPFVPTRVFVSAYLLVWSLCGGVAYPFAVLIEKLAAPSMWLMENAARLGGGCPAGGRSLSTLTPKGHLLVEMPHACAIHPWLLFVILFPLGLMNIAVMALLTALIYAEKALPIGRQISQLVGGGLIVYGVLVIFLPAALPMGM
jgi:predicted metal-binding membrane protein